MSLSETDGRIPVIVDTDIGDDIDDTFALAFLLSQPRVDVKLIVTSTDDTAAKSRLVAKILHRLGRHDIPIGAGVQTTARQMNQELWLGDYDLAGYPGQVYEDGISKMVGMLRGCPDRMTICSLGPQTNLAEGLSRAPDIARRADVVMMAGSINSGYDGIPGQVAEYNILRDVRAARAVFGAPWHITMAPLDACWALALDGEDYAAVMTSKSPLATIVAQNYRAWSRRSDFPEDRTSPLFDTLAAYLVVESDLCRLQDMHLTIEDDGRTALSAGGRPVRCALELPDKQAFSALLVEALVSRPTRMLDAESKRR